MEWSWAIWIYLWAAGIAGGGYFAAFLIDRFDGRKHKELLQTATWLGIPLVAIGTLLLIVDLGEQLRFWHLLTRVLPVSPMSAGTWLLTLWAIGAVALIVLWQVEKGSLATLTEVISWIVLALSVLLITYTGVLLSNTNTSLWVSLFLPALFVVSAIATGTAAIMLVQALRGREMPEELSRAAAILTGLEVLALIAFLVTVPAGVLIGGPLALFFWIGVVVVGLLVPFGLEAWAWRGKSLGRLVLVASLCVLLGGLVLRAVVVVGGQI